MTNQSVPPPLIGRLSADAELARQAAFALFVLVHLERTGMMPRHFVVEVERGRARAPVPVGELPGAVAAVLTQNPHLLVAFADPARAGALGELDAAAAAELLGWLQAQQVEREEPQIAYELGMLALGVELPAIMVRALRQAEVGPETRVVELPDGSGYPTVFLATLHPQWKAAPRARIFVEGVDAEQLAAWAFLLLTGTLRPPPGAISHLDESARAGLQEGEFDLALVYNPRPWLAASGDLTAVVRARQVIVA
ncbi:MAG TPA: hypothetical protein VHS99_22425 [Chloroflexota bacterium]|nr:hypothetical protein [Chloroflexota bacterium]